jgi:putative oxidoreductase
MSVDLALRILRVAIGGLLCAHGTQKLFGWFGGGGLTGTRSMIQSQRMRPVWVWMWMAIFSEAGGGLFFALGLLNPLGSLGMIAAMGMAMFLVTWPRFWGYQNGIENNLLFLIPAVAVAIAGPGRYSLDAVLGLALPAPASFIIGLLLVAIGMGVALATRLPASKLTTSVDHALPRQPVRH